MALTPAQATVSFTAHPRTFLKKYPLVVTEFPGVASSQAVSYLETAGMHDGTLRPGRVLGSLRMHETQSFVVRPVAGRAFQSQQLPVHFIQMYSRDVAIAWYNPTGGHAVLVTPQLTGCSFVVRLNADGSISCAHIQPSAIEAGVALNTRLSAAGYAAVYGRNSYGNDDSVNVIGARVNGGWKIYAQRMDRRNTRIHDVTRIYPTE